MEIATLWGRLLGQPFAATMEKVSGGPISVISRTEVNPPGSPADLDTFFVPAVGATGAWASLGGKVVFWKDEPAAWLPLTLRAGTLLHVQDEGGAIVTYDGAVLVSHPHDWGDITGTPTTLAGYGISDAASASDLASHAADTTGIHGIADTAVLVTLAGIETLSNKTLVAPALGAATATSINGIDLTAATAAVLTLQNSVTVTGPAGLAGVATLATLNVPETFTGAKTFGTPGGAVGKLKIAGATSGTGVLAAPAVVPGGCTWVLPSAATTLASLDLAETFTNKTLTTPVIGDFTSATHTHANAAGGGTLDGAVIASGTVAPARLGSGSGGATKYLREDSTWQANDVAAHEADTTAIHGIADTAQLVTLTGSQALTNKTYEGVTITPVTATLTLITGVVVTGPAGLGGVATLASTNVPETFTGAKTFGTPGGAVGKLKIAGATSGTGILAAPLVVPGGCTWVLPSAATTLASLDLAETFTNKTLTTPVIGDFTSANHTHTNAAGGGTLDAAATASGTFDRARLGSGSGGLGTKFLADDSTWKTVSGGALSDSDYGDITVSGTGTVMTIDPGVVTLAKLADLAQDLFIIRTSGSTGVPQTATCTAAARSVLDDTTVGAMVDTLFGAASTGTGGAMRRDSPVVTTEITVPNTGLHLLDTNASHDLIVKPGSDLTADRTLTVTTGDADRVLTMTANASIGGTNTGDQTLDGLGGQTLGQIIALSRCYASR